jgi:hypothetical protein
LQNHDGDSEVVYGNFWVIDDATTETLSWATLTGGGTAIRDHEHQGGKLRPLHGKSGFTPDLIFGRDGMGRKTKDAASTQKEIR